MNTMPLLKNKPVSIQKLVAPPVTYSAIKSRINPRGNRNFLILNVERVFVSKDGHECATCRVIDRDDNQTEKFRTFHLDRIES